MLLMGMISNHHKNEIVSNGPEYLLKSIRSTYIHQLYTDEHSAQGTNDNRQIRDQDQSEDQSELKLRPKLL